MKANTILNLPDTDENAIRAMRQMSEKPDRANRETVDGVDYICYGDHEKHEPCEYVPETSKPSNLDQAHDRLRTLSRKLSQDSLDVADTALCAKLVWQVRELLKEAK